VANLVAFGVNMTHAHLWVTAVYGLLGTFDFVIVYDFTKNSCPQRKLYLLSVMATQ
jgi:hypothetical protein